MSSEDNWKGYDQYRYNNRPETVPINWYLVEADTKEILATETKTLTPTYSDVDLWRWVQYSSLPRFSQYYRIPDSFLEFEAVYTMLYAVHNGTVFSLRKYDETTGAYIPTTSTQLWDMLYGDEVMDTWIVYCRINSCDEMTEESNWTNAGKDWFYRDAYISEDCEAVRLKFSDIPYTQTFTTVEEDEDNDIQFTSVSISQGLISGSCLSYGDTVSPTCSVEMTKCDYAIPKVWFRVEFKIDGIWQNMGIFYINSLPSKTSEYISFEGVGILEAIGDDAINDYFTPESLHVEDISNGPVNPNLTEYYYGLITLLPISIDFYGDLIDNGELNFMLNILKFPFRIVLDGESRTGAEELLHSLGDGVREVISNLSAGLCSNAIERNGVVHIVNVPFQKEDDDALNVRYTPDQYTEEPTELDPNMVFYASPITVTANDLMLQHFSTDYGFRWENEEGDTVEYTVMDTNYDDDTSSSFTFVRYPLSIDASHTAMFFKNYATTGGWTAIPDYNKRWRDFLYSNENILVHPTIYKPLEMEIQGYSPLLVSGHFIDVERESEGTSWENIHELVGNVTITYDGSISMSVSTPCDVDMSGASSSTYSSASSSSENMTSLLYKINSNKYTLPNATTSTLGGVIVGDGLTVSDGVLSVDSSLVADLQLNQKVASEATISSASRSLTASSSTEITVEAVESED